MRKLGWVENYGYAPKQTNLHVQENIQGATGNVAGDQLKKNLNEIVSEFTLFASESQNYLQK